MTPITCADCGATLHEADLADGRVCHICFKTRRTSDIARPDQTCGRCGAAFATGEAIRSGACLDTADCIARAKFADEQARRAKLDRAYHSSQRRIYRQPAEQSRQWLQTAVANGSRALPSHHWQNAQAGEGLEAARNRALDGLRQECPVCGRPLLPSERAIDGRCRDKDQCVRDAGDYKMPLGAAEEIPF
jgi:hypothetical protein